MEVLSPTHPPGQAEDLFSGFSPQATFRPGFEGRSQNEVTQSPEMVEEDGGKVHVAVGKSEAKTEALLQWCFRTFVNSEICILHVHRPSPLIPTLLGKLPASQANPEVVTAFRNVEWEETRKLLHNYWELCNRSKVKASIITSEADQVQTEIVNLVSRHDIKKLVIGAIPDCSKLKKCSSKASYAAKMAPPFCKIWFINKGKLVWMRQDSQSSSSTALISQPEPVPRSNLRSQSAPCMSNLISHPECVHSRSAQYPASSGTRIYFQREEVSMETASSPTFPSGCNPSFFHLLGTAGLSSNSGDTSFAETMVSSSSGTKVDDESLYDWIDELKKESHESRDEALSELLRCRKLEAKAIEAIKEVKAFESAHAREVKLRKEAEDALGTAIKEQEKLIEEREIITRELQKAMRNIAVLDSRAQEANRRCEAVAGELKLIQASVATLHQEKQKIQRQKIEAVRWLDHWKSRTHINGGNANGLIQLTAESFELAEFSLSDLQAATCNFSESFKIGKGGYGTVYKGEMLDRTVAIKMLHPHSTQKQPEFYQEAQVLGRLHHPYLATLIGVCPEARSLVYEYLPGGSLQDRLFHRSTVCPLDWKTRVRFISEIASGLLVLHSSGSEGITHGDLKPNNILLDSENCCKICDFGIFRLVPDQTLRCPSFRRYTETRGVFPYADPEFHRTGILTPKSDIFSFGLIILQLITGKAPSGLVCEVRKMVSRGKMTSILDSSAGEWSTFVTRRLVDLALQCCELNGRDRPCLTPTLVRELENLHVLEERTVPSFFLCPILQEIMHDPQVASDGFTYEGEALRGWLENGRETSPMTNLKLSHLTLTPNHALRFAIQEWLCKS
ncbi:hypothetical protein ACH5RR_010067 [Cinchona calisaya]|uniref:RING-type E3 ubiquitin transferase n=1 Tax=Cinchona calisaya TaxID=153742 RepID=A0ABD3AIC1_9GENT